MKKNIVPVLFITMLMCSACTNHMTVNNMTKQPDSLQEQSAALEAADSEPSWAAGMQTEGQLFQNLNLDGIGDADDEVYISTYQFGDYEEKVTVVRIHLGTGQTVAKVFPVYGHYEFQTGRLFSEEKDAVILEIRIPASNYGAAAVFVLNVNPAGAAPVPEAVIQLDTQNPVTLANGIVIENSVLSNQVTNGTKAADISGMPRQGILLNFIDENGRYQGLQRVFYWTDDGWTVISEKAAEEY